MRTRDLSLEHSVGAFDGKRLVGFILCGYRKSRNGATLYDGGTGVVPDYRGKGIASAMLSWILREAARKDIDRFLLEVLEHNRAAQELYLKAGFSNRRFFHCYRLDKDLVGQQVLDSPYFFEPLEKTRFEKFDHQKFLTFEPSWQNDVPSVLHNWDQLAGLSIICDGQIGWIITASRFHLSSTRRDFLPHRSASLREVPIPPSRDSLLPLQASSPKQVPPPHVKSLVCVLPVPPHAFRSRMS